MQESGLQQVHRYTNVLIEDKAGKYVKIKGITDVGVWQFHIDTIKDFDIDINKLMTDLEYATHAHFRILKDKIRECSHLKTYAWTCYHSKTKRHREYYKKRVKRFYLWPKKNGT
jgi:hypothetical protein